MTLAYTVFSSPIGELLVAGNEESVTCVTHEAGRFLKANAYIPEAPCGSVVDKAAHSIHAFLKGETRQLKLAFTADGTPFQQSVWNQLLRIPYGETANYSQIAEYIGKPAAFRAVANACGQNPIPLIIPCHRVVHKSGNVSGFAWGVEIKRKLLELEASHTVSKAAA